MDDGVIGLKNLLGYHRMNKERTNEGGWLACDMRRYLNEEEMCIRDRHNAGIRYKYMVPASPPVAESTAAEGKVEQGIDRKYHNEQNPAGHIAPAQSTEHQGLLSGISIEFRGIAVRRGGKDVKEPMSGDILPAAFLIDADLFLRQAVIRVQERCV